MVPPQPDMGQIHNSVWGEFFQDLQGFMGSERKEEVSRRVLFDKNWPHFVLPGSCNE